MGPFKRTQVPQGLDCLSVFTEIPLIGAGEQTVMMKRNQAAAGRRRRRVMKRRKRVTKREAEMRRRGKLIKKGG